MLPAVLALAATAVAVAVLTRAAGRIESVAERPVPSTSTALGDAASAVTEGLEGLRRAVDRNTDQ